MRRQSASESGRRPGRRGFARLLLTATWAALFGCGAAPEDVPATDALRQTPNGAAAVRTRIRRKSRRAAGDRCASRRLHPSRRWAPGRARHESHRYRRERRLLHRPALRSPPDVELVALFAPEHGIRGTAEAGAQISSEVDGVTGLPIHSLYGDTLRPTPESLEGIDVLLFDIQDIGARYYTYVSTMAYAMEAAGEAGIPFVVLDRPNPIGGELVQGNLLEPEFSSFVGLYPIPMRHGMTPAELARLLRRAFRRERGPARRPRRGVVQEHALSGHRSAVARAVAQHARHNERPPLSRHMSLRGDEPVGRAGDGPAFPMGGRALDRRRSVGGSSLGAGPSGRHPSRPRASRPCGQATASSMA